MNLLVYVFAILILFPLSLLPLRVLYILSDFTAFLLFRVLKYRRQVVTDNLSKTFPSLSETERRKVEKAFYYHLSDLMFETIKCLTISKKEMKKRCEIKDLHILDEYAEKERSVVAVLGHYGNWEWAALSSALSVKQQMVVIYKPLTNDYFNQLINRTRSRFGVKMVAMKDAFRFYFENRDKVFVNCFVADQSPQNRRSVQWHTFLNQETAVTAGPEKIARKFDHAVIFVSLQKIKRGFYHLRMKKLTENPNLEPDEGVTRLHLHALEAQVLEKPEHWLWSHRRWKLKMRKSEPNNSK
ncbi:MAG: lysophospholipid acyltransferase family protein [Bacteroidota bacterium]